MKTPHDAIEPDATPEEQAQAEALAQALEKGQGVTAQVLAEPLEAAALLKQTRQGKAPPPSQVMDTILPALQARRKRRRWWLWPAILVTAMTALALLTVPMHMRSSAPVAVPTMIPPQPSVELLKAQADLARGDRKALATLDREMRRYRASFYSAMGAR